MELILENIGKISKADIQLDGITIICGENNTGKSTIGKALFCVFNSFYDINKVILESKKKNIQSVFIKCAKNVLGNEGSFLMDDSYFYVNNNNDDYSKICMNSNIDLYSIICEINRKFVESQTYIEDKEKIINQLNEEVFVSIKDMLEISDDAYKINRILKYCNNVFNNQVINVNSNTAYIRAIINGQPMRIGFVKGFANFICDFSIIHTATLICNPFIIDDLYNLKGSNHIINRDLMDKLKIALQKSELLNDEDLVSKTLKQEKLQSIEKILNETIPGRIISTSTGRKAYMENSTDKPINFDNLSTGVKAFLILKILIENEIINEKDVLILDEPEIHLHPEWQLKYAEFIVLLQKTLNLTVLITTHSPQFLRAIECFTDKYETMDNLNVYSITESGIENVSYSEYGISEIYDKLSKPYDTLQQMLDEKYGGDYE